MFVAVRGHWTSEQAINMHTGYLQLPSCGKLAAACHSARFVRLKTGARGVSWAMHGSLTTAWMASLAGPCAQVDLIVVGSSAVCPSSGARLGKGEVSMA